MGSSNRVSVSEKGGSKMLDEKGKSYGLWKVIDFSHLSNRNEAHWLCECLCDGGRCKRRRAVLGSDLRAGKSTQCGMRRRWGPRRLAQEQLNLKIQSLLDEAKQLVGKRRT